MAAASWVGLAGPPRRVVQWARSCSPLGTGSLFTSGYVLYCALSWAYVKARAILLLMQLMIICYETHTFPKAWLCPKPLSVTKLLYLAPLDSDTSVLPVALPPAFSLCSGVTKRVWVY